MAYTTSRDVTTPWGEGYHGPSSRLTMEFSGTPGLSGAIAAAINSGTGWTPGLRGKLLHYAIEQDPTPIFDKYRVTVDLAGAPEREASGTVQYGQVKESGVGVGHRGIGALPVIIVIAIALGILALFGALTFKLVKSSWKEIGSGVAAGLGPLLLIGGGLFIAYQALAKKGIVPQRNPEKRGGNGMLVGAAVVGVGLLLMASKGSGKDGDGRNGDDGGGIPIPPPPVTPAISKFNVRWS